MSKQGTVTINGQGYDAVTGLPITLQSDITAANAIAPETRHTPTSPATNLHAKIQRSTTLNRKFIKKPTPVRTTIVGHRSRSVSIDGVKPSAHHHVRKFAPHPAGATQAVDIGPVTHPLVAKAHAQSAAKAAAATISTHTPAAEIKKETLAKAVANAHQTKKAHMPQFLRQRQRVTGVIAATFALVLLGGYFTYINMPSLSVRVAAAQAGINASYPNYHPDGYALNGPVSYSDGRVSMNFKANGSSSAFTVNQSKSSWNSDAVLDNYITPRAGSGYIPYTERGLTIYTYGNNAAWVNGGIFYTIEGDAPLSSDQIRRIATSLL